MFTDIENRLLIFGILSGLLAIMLYTGQMEFASATFGIIIGVIAPTKHIVTTARIVVGKEDDE